MMMRRQQNAPIAVTLFFADNGYNSLDYDDLLTESLFDTDDEGQHDVWIPTASSIRSPA